MTDDPALPEWVTPLRVAQMLWEKYGIVSDIEMTMTDVVRANRLDHADAARKRNLQARG